MRFPLTSQLLEEARRFELRSACGDCFYFVASSARCAHEWPNEEQSRWPLDATGPNNEPPTTAQFCKEFELR